MLKFCQMTGPGLANAAGQAVAMHCVRGRSGVTKPAPGPLCCILWAFSGGAPRRTDGKFTVKLLSGGGRHRSRVTFALTGGYIAVQPVSCQSTTQITALQHAPQATTNPAVFVRAAASSHPSLCSRTPPCAEAMTHTSQTPKAGHALNQIFCYGLYMAASIVALPAHAAMHAHMHAHPTAAPHQLDSFRCSRRCISGASCGG